MCRSGQNYKIVNMKLLNFLFKKKKRSELITEKVDFIVSELFLSGFTIIEIAIIVESIKKLTSDKIEQKAIILSENFRELAEAKTILKRV